MSARRPIEFELGLKAAIADETIEAERGRALLTPSLPRVWDALADSALGEAGFSHRTVAPPLRHEGQPAPGKAIRRYKAGINLCLLGFFGSCKGLKGKGSAKR